MGARHTPQEGEPNLSVQLISEKLFEFAGEFEHEVMDAYASEFLSENRAGGPAQANRSARDTMGTRWDTSDGRLSLVSGKQLLAKLSTWAQERYGVALSAARVARALRRGEIADEVVGVLTAIENGEPF